MPSLYVPSSEGDPLSPQEFPEAPLMLILPAIVSLPHQVGGTTDPTSLVYVVDEEDTRFLCNWCLTIDPSLGRE